MNDIKRNFQLDEFWSDCMNIHYSNNNKYNNKQVLNNSSNNHKSEIKSIKSKDKNTNNKRKFFLRKKLIKHVISDDPENIKLKILSKTKSEYNLKNIKDALEQEDLIPLKKKKNNEKIGNVFISLYKKGTLGRDQWIKNNAIQKERKEKLKLEECTFKPQKCMNKKLEKKINNLYNNTNIYERNIKLQQKHKEKIAFLFNETNKINNNYTSGECYFHPYINTNKNIEKVLYDDNFWKNQADNDSTRLFLLRYMKAREEEYEKKEKINTFSFKNLKYNFSYPKNMVRSVSQKDSLILKKNLHDNLYSFEILFSEEKEKDDNNDKEDNNKTEEEQNKNKEVKKVDNFQWAFAKKNKN